MTEFSRLNLVTYFPKTLYIDIKLLQHQKKKIIQLLQMVIPVSTKFSRSLSDLRFLNISRRERIMDYNEYPLISLANRIPDPSEEIFFVVKQQSSEVPRQHVRHSSISSTVALGVSYTDPHKFSNGASQILRLQNLFAVKPCLLQLTLGKL